MTYLQIKDFSRYFQYLDNIKSNGCATTERNCVGLLMNKFGFSKDVAYSIWRKWDALYNK